MESGAETDIGEKSTEESISSVDFAEYLNVLADHLKGTLRLSRISLSLSESVKKIQDDILKYNWGFPGERSVKVVVPGGAQTIDLDSNIREVKEFRATSMRGVDEKGIQFFDDNSGTCLVVNGDEFYLEPWDQPDIQEQ